MRVAVVGGGIVGLAVARQAQLAGADVVVYEGEGALARGQTGRNSGVVHAGLYYEPGSLKARLCRRGMTLLKAFCVEHDVPYVECGKLLVATDAAEVDRLERIAERGAANGVPGLRTVRPEEVEPHARGVAALHSPATAITDFGAVARSLAAAVVASGGAVRTSAAVVRAAAAADGGAVLELVGDGAAARADRVLVCAGLNTAALAEASGAAAEPRIRAVRGDYWRLAAGRRHLVRGLVYPVPDPAQPYLGVHLSPTVHGDVLVGPTAGDESPVAALALVEGLTPHDLTPAWSGERAQAFGAGGAPLHDFVFIRDGAVTWVRNAPSPAATAALAIAEELVD